MAATDWIEWLKVAYGVALLWGVWSIAAGITECSNKLSQMLIELRDPRR